MFTPRKLAKLVALLSIAAAAMFLRQAAPVAARSQEQDQAEFFEMRVRPLLIENCHMCHTEARQGGLRLDSKHSILKGGSRGPAVVPGRPEESLLIKAVSYLDEHLRMPPPGKLTDEEIGYLTKWIKDGAYWPETPGDFFEARIRPVLEQSCLPCHDDADPSNDLRLDSREAVLKGGKSGPAVIPGDPDNSLLIQSVKHTHPEFLMPPGSKLHESDIEALTQWVKTGAIWSESSSAPKETSITTEQRGFWSFQPLQKQTPPEVRRKDWPRSPVDNFILAALERRRLDPAAAADRRTLIRRATYDLTGLPPTPEEIDSFLSDRSPNAFEKVVDRLLASPRYGERWGRHWLDLVRYADSAGDSADYPIPQAYLYRDWVIDSFNRDKPYDQFLGEQIAGDLLPSKGEPERWDRTVATGYLALSRRFSVRPERNMHLTIEDTIDNLGKTFLGLTISCARCHDHKYDPIPMRDYYALYGIFSSTRYPFAGSENIQHQQDVVTRLPKQEVDRILKPFNEKLAPIEADLKRLQEEKKALEEAFPRAADPVATRQSIKEKNSAIQDLKKKRVAVAMTFPDLEMAFAVAEGTPRNARIQKRGDPRNLGDEVARGFLEVLGGQKILPNVTGSGRLQLGDWLTRPASALTARVMVNRIWQHHFGRGIVSTPSDFGIRGKPPSHPELLDYLAARFMESGWSVKAMNRLIMLSRTYQLASSGRLRNTEADTENQLFRRFNRRRLNAEEIRDSMLAVSGELDLKPAGPHPFPHSATWGFTQHYPFAANYDSKRRSVYLMTQRIQRHPYLSIFDGADTNTATAERVATTTPIQALFLMNSEFVHEQADGFAARLIRQEESMRGRIQRAYLISLGRPPDARETDAALRHIERVVKRAGNQAEEGERAALASFLRVLLSSNEFMYID